MHRPTIGIIAIVLLATAALLAIIQPGDDALMAASVRVGLVMGALWLAHPQLSRLPGWLIFGVLAAVLLIISFLRPRPLLILVSILVIVVIFIFRPRGAVRPPQGR